MVFLVAETVGVNESSAHGQLRLPGLEERGAKMADTAYMTAPKATSPSGLARVDGKPLFDGRSDSAVSRLFSVQ